MSDDLPAPLGPRIAVCSPRWIASDSPSSTRIPPRTSVAFRSSSTGSTRLILEDDVLAFVDQWSADALCVGVALMWLVPNRRIEAILLRD